MSCCRQVMRFKSNIATQSRVCRMKPTETAVELLKTYRSGTVGDFARFIDNCNALAERAVETHNAGVDRASSLK